MTSKNIEAHIIYRNKMLCRLSMHHAPRATLKEADVIKIRGLHRLGMSQVDIGKKYNNRKSSISGIINKKSWSHI